MKYFLIVTIFCIAFIGCEKDEATPDIPGIILSDCDEDNNDYEPHPFENMNHEIDHNYTYRIDTMCLSPKPGCSLIEVPDTFYLQKQARSFLPQSGLATGDKIFYVNENGEFQHFTITLKDHAISKSYYTLPCGTAEGYCFNSERYELQMFSQDCKYQLIIQVRASIRFDGNNDFQQLDGMSILDPNYREGLNAIFYLPLYDDAQIDAEYYPQHTFMGEEFNDVYMMNKYGKMQVFYNSEYGLLGFVDEEEMEWKIFK